MKKEVIHLIYRHIVITQCELVEKSRKGMHVVKDCHDALKISGYNPCNIDMSISPSVDVGLNQRLRLTVIGYYLYFIFFLFFASS